MFCHFSTSNFTMHSYIFHKNLIRTVEHKQRDFGWIVYHSFHSNWTDKLKVVCLEWHALVQAATSHHWLHLGAQAVTYYNWLPLGVQAATSYHWLPLGTQAVTSYHWLPLGAQAATSYHWLPLGGQTVTYYHWLPLRAQSATSYHWLPLGAQSATSYHWLPLGGTSCHLLERDMLTNWLIQKSKMAASDLEHIFLALWSIVYFTSCKSPRKMPHHDFNFIAMYGKSSNMFVSNENDGIFITNLS